MKKNPPLIALFTLILVVIGSFAYINSINFKPLLTNQEATAPINPPPAPSDSQPNPEKNHTLIAQKDGETAFELLQKKLELTYQEYDFGVFITSINGLKANDQFYWALYLNGEYAQTGADQIILQAGDSIEIKYQNLEDSSFKN